jgi:hypothetical protein
MYTEKQIAYAKEKIKELCTILLANRKSISGKDISYIFQQYDKIFFTNQIADKIQSTESSLSFHIIKGNKTENIRGIVGKTGKKSFYIDFIVQANDKIHITDLMLTMEHSIINLIMILWDFTVSTTLFKCGYTAYFGTKGLLTKIKTSIFVLNAGYENWSNSCYLDSLLMVLLYSIDSFWKSVIFEDTKGTIKNLVTTPDVCKNPKVNYKVLTNEIKKQIIKDYEDLGKGEPKRCSKLRSLLATCLPQMKENGQWVMFNVGAVYEALATVFPELTLKIPTQIFKKVDGEIEYVLQSNSQDEVPLLSFWDFMDANDQHEGAAAYKALAFDKVESEILVFYNGGTPRIKKLNETGVEKGYFMIDNTKYLFEANKARAFGESILGGPNDKFGYDLVGVITLEGISPNNEGGSHYTAHYKGNDGKWYYYNDLGAIVKPVNSLPIVGVWTEAQGKMPSMYFYKRQKKMVSLKKTNINNITKSPMPKNPWIGQSIDIKWVQRPDSFVMVFVTDKTVNTLKIKYLDTIKPEPVTKLSEEKRVWRVPDDQFDDLFRKLIAIDEKLIGSPSLTFTKTHKAVETFGTDEAKITVYDNYSEKSFAIAGPGVNLIASNFETDGLHINLKHDLGRGLVFSNTKRAKIIKALHLLFP